jgi:DNA mismatch repair protein MutS
MKHSFVRTVFCFIISVFLSIQVHSVDVISPTDPAAAVEAGDYSELKKFFMATLHEEAEQEKKDAERINIENEKIDKKWQAKKLQVSELGSVEALGFLYDNFDHQLTSSQMLDPRVIEELHLLCGGSKDTKNNVFSKLDLTETMFGKVELQNMLCHPLVTIDELKKRQDTIKTLADDEELLNALNEKIQKIKSTEKDVIEFFKPQDSASKAFFDQAFFKESWTQLHRLNKNSKALSASYLWSMTVSPLWAISFPVTFEVFSWLIPKTILYYTLGASAAAEHTFKTALNIRWGFLWDNNIEIEPKLALASLTGFWQILSVSGMYSSVSNAWFLNNLTKTIQGKVISVGEFCRTAQDISDLIQTNPVLSINTDITAVIQEFFSEDNEVNSQDTKDVLTTVDSGVSKGNPRLFTDKGKVVTTYKKMFNAVKDFVPPMHAVGQLDALVSAAKTYKRLASGTNGKVCWVEFIDSPTTHYDAKGLFHPILNPETATKNDLSLGGDNVARCAMVTGPNACGKTTFLETAMLNAIVAQSYGFAFSDEFTLAPYTMFISLVDKSDQMGEASLFQAEARTTMATRRKIREELGDGQRAMIIFDELCTSTGEGSGAAFAYTTMKELSKLKMVNALLSTHFPQITVLEQETGGIVQNLKVYAHELDNGTVKPSYEISQGSSTQNIVLPLLREEGFDESFLSEIQSFLERQKEQQSSLKYERARPTVDCC